MWHDAKLAADLDTPVSAYAKLRGLSSWSFLFESVEGQEQWASYSILGFGCYRSFRADAGTFVIEDSAGTTHIETRDPLATLRAHAALAEVPGLPVFCSSIFGCVAYDCVRAYAPLVPRPEGLDLIFFAPSVLCVFDNRRHTMRVFSRDHTQLTHAVGLLEGRIPSLASTPMLSAHTTSDLDQPSFERSVSAAQEYIRAGHIIQVVLSRRIQLQGRPDPFYVYRGLRHINPSPYMYLLETPHGTLAGASPEVMVRVQASGVLVRPIAGTRPRGVDAAADQRLEAELRADHKERAEHIMLVDLGRNDVGRVSTPGSVRVDSLMHVERYSHVMHLVSQVEGTMRPDADAFDALRACFPAGTLSGAPKVRAMQIIDELEPTRRGFYGGAVGYFGPNTTADFGIAIRTLVFEEQGVSVQVGAGIVADSVPEREWQETEHKAQAVIRALSWSVA